MKFLVLSSPSQSVNEYQNMLTTGVYVRSSSSPTGTSRNRYGVSRRYHAERRPAPPGTFRVGRARSGSAAAAAAWPVKLEDAVVMVTSGAGVGAALGPLGVQVVEDLLLGASAGAGVVDDLRAVLRVGGHDARRGVD